MKRKRNWRPIEFQSLARRGHEAPYHLRRFSVIAFFAPADIHHPPGHRRRVVVGIPKKWAKGFDPDDIASDSFKACDSGAHYWVSKSIGNNESNINRVCDRGVTHEAVGRTSVLVNGGGYGFTERQSYAAYIKRFLDDTVDASASASFSVVHGNNTHTVYVDFTPQRP